MSQASSLLGKNLYFWFQDTLTKDNTYRKLHDIKYGKLLKEKYAILLQLVLNFI